MKGLVCFVYSLDREDMVFSHQQRVVKELSLRFQPFSIVTRKAADPLDRLELKTYVIRWNENRTLSLAKFIVKSIPLVFHARKQNQILFFLQTDLYAAILSPIAKLIGVKSALWYAHKTESRYLKFARRFVDIIFSANTESITAPESKTKIVGHFVDSAVFPPRSGSLNNNQLRKFFYVGRCDKAKRIDSLLTVFENLSNSQQDLELFVMGEPSTESNQAYFDELVSRNKIWQHSNIKLLGKVSRENLSDLMHELGIMIHATDGSLDKVLIEATLALNPVATCNLGYIREFGSWSSQKGSTDDVKKIMEEVFAILSLTPSELSKKLQQRREIALKNHSLVGWTDKVSSILTSMRASV
jgi:glycosyltransferase involved in cell wall biosynthesis